VRYEILALAVNMESVKNIIRIRQYKYSRECCVVEFHQNCHILETVFWILLYNYIRSVRLSNCVMTGELIIG